MVLMVQTLYSQLLMLSATLISVFLAWLNGFFHTRLLELASHNFAAMVFRWALPKVAIVGQDKLQALENKPAIFVANHTTILDIPILMQLTTKVRFLAKKELGKIPFFGRALVSVGHFLVDRNSPDSRRRSLESIKSRLSQSGNYICIFPEGTRNPDPDRQPVLPFKKGAFRIAEDLDLPIIVVAIVGAAQMLPKKAFWFHQYGPLAIHVLAIQKGITAEQAQAMMSDFLKNSRGKTPV